MTEELDGFSGGPDEDLGFQEEPGSDLPEEIEASIEPREEGGADPDETTEQGTDDPVTEGDEVVMSGEDDLDAWLAQEEAALEEQIAAEPGTVGALGELEFESWLGDALEAAPEGHEGPPSSDQLIEQVLRERGK